ncbi:hypothetical protein [Solitalea canadensis]|nr:hypothetical protein [Solitalea canadensis]
MNYEWTMDPNHDPRSMNHELLTIYQLWTIDYGLWTQNYQL